jgi:hypothetical protein
MATTVKMTQARGVVLRLPSVAIPGRGRGPGVVVVLKRLARDGVQR